ncbi:hypothetical protein BsWGS_16448 [Bradybaena similaris]
MFDHVFMLWKRVLFKVVDVNLEYCKCCGRCWNRLNDLYMPGVIYSLPLSSLLVNYSHRWLDETWILSGKAGRDKFFNKMTQASFN